MRTQYDEYDSARRVSLEKTAGAGSNLGSGDGRGTTTYSYSQSTNGDDYNSWKYKTVVTLPDGSTDTVYANYLQQVMLKVHRASTVVSPEFYHYDSMGNIDMYAHPSAFQADGSGHYYDDTYADLLNDQGGGDYEYLANNAGEIDHYDLGSSTTATATTAGDVAGELKDTKLYHGDQDTSPTLVSSVDYFLHTYTPSGTGAVSSDLKFTADQTLYSGSGGTGGRTTSYAYTYLLDGSSNETNQPLTVTTTLPTIGSGDGPGSSTFRPPCTTSMAGSPGPKTPADSSTTSPTTRAPAQ